MMITRNGPFTVDAVNSDHLHDIIFDGTIKGAGNPILVAHVFADEKGDTRPGNLDPHEATRLANAAIAQAEGGAS